MLAKPRTTVILSVVYYPQEPFQFNNSTAKYQSSERFLTFLYNALYMLITEIAFLFSYKEVM
jgi:hypothetical protein